MGKRKAASFLLLLSVFVNSAATAAESEKSEGEVSEVQTDEIPASTKKQTRLQGSVIETVKPSPFLFGSISEIPSGVKLKLSVMGNLNSQLSKPGDEILARISYDVSSGEKVILPSGWFIHGTVKEA